MASGGHSSSRCAGLSPSRPLLLRSTGSRRAGSVGVAHGPSCSAACGILPDQGSNPCPLHWQADSQPLRHQGSPLEHFLKLLVFYRILLYILSSSHFMHSPWVNPPTLLGFSPTSSLLPNAWPSTALSSEPDTNIQSPYEHLHWMLTSTSNSSYPPQKLSHFPPKVAFFSLIFYSKFESPLTPFPIFLLPSYTNFPYVMHL